MLYLHYFLIAVNVRTSKVGSIWNWTSMGIIFFGLLIFYVEVWYFYMSYAMMKAAEGLKQAALENPDDSKIEKYKKIIN